MTPQTHVMYAAPLRDGTKAQVQALLQGMNLRPGVYNPANGIIPLHTLPQMHFARVLVVLDLAAEDRPVYGLSATGLPDYLVFLAEVDGDETAFRADLVRAAAPGLRRIFEHCQNFRAGEPLAAWLGAASTPAAATYVNWRGRTVVQVREEEVLRRELRSYAAAHESELRQMSAEQCRRQLRKYVEQQQQAGRITLSPEASTPIGWRLRNLLHLIGVPLILLLVSPLLLLTLPLLFLQIRHYERTDPAVAPPVDPAHADALLNMENHEVTNQFNVFGSLKPGRQRIWTVRFLLCITDYVARHLYHCGNLARVSTIHFARWVPMDGGKRMLFSSLYDGSLESYMDDFINKVGFGLNVTFSDGIGYPSTRWLLLEGCNDEQTFKRVLRRHQLPTEVWYNAHPGLTAANKHRNLLIRRGLKAAGMTEEKAQAWLALI